MSADHASDRDLHEGADIVFEITDQMNELQIGTGAASEPDDLLIAMVLEGSGEEFQCERVTIVLTQ